MGDVYLFNQLKNLSPSMLKSAKEIASLQRLKKVNRLRFKKDQTQSLLAYILFLYAYQAQTGIILNKPEFMFGRFGKPYIYSPQGLHFSLSHCDLAVCCAISSSKIGVDVEAIVNRGLAINSAFSEGEKRQIQIADQPNRERIRLWTCKESYLKYTGTGLRGRLSELDFSKCNHNNPMYANVKLISYEETSFFTTVCSDTIPRQYYVVSVEEVEHFLSKY